MEEKLPEDYEKMRHTKMANGQYRVSEKLKNPKISKPTYIAGYVTAYSRTLLNEVIRKVGAEKIYYSDTDSVYIKYSDFMNSGLKCSNGLCGFKNDYGDGVMITKARFLDIKRCYFEFRNKVIKEKKDKWGKPLASCKDPITKKVNQGEEYYVKTFKFKYTGINFKDIVKSSALEPDNKLYSEEKTYEEYYKVMNNTSKIVDKFIENNKKNVEKTEKDEINNIEFLMKRFKKDGQNVVINITEFAFNVTPEKRGCWEGENFYALGFNKDLPEVQLYKDGDVGDIVKKFAKYPRTSYGFMKEDDKKYLRSKRPLFYNIRMHIEVIKEKADSLKLKVRSNNEFLINYNNAEVKSKYIQEVFDGYLKYLEGEKDRETNSKYLTFLNAMSKLYIKDDKKIEILINNDVVYDKSRTYDADYYIEFYEDLEFVKKDDYLKKYRILAKMCVYAKEGKRSEFFIPNFINVKGRADNVDESKIYPVIMLSTRFNNELGLNNLENWQALSIMNNFI